MEYILITLVALNVLQSSYLIAKTGVGRASRRKNPIFIDTSALIDGRIEAIAESGFMQGEFFIPRSVIAELQFMADNADGEKRARARHGLDVAALLRASQKTNVSLHHDTRSPSDGVDNQLLALAKKYNGAICTVDFNLNKVAHIESVRVLNVNELAKQLRVEYLPGETVSIQLLQKGNEAHQGVGYFSDGTMVVVERASSQIGKTVDVEVVRSLQTDAGRMVFAKLAKPEQSKNSKKAQSKQNDRTGNEKTSPKSSGDSKAKTLGRQRRTNEDRMVELANR